MNINTHSREKCVDVLTTTGLILWTVTYMVAGNLLAYVVNTGLFWMQVAHAIGRECALVVEQRNTSPTRAAYGEDDDHTTEKGEDLPF